MTDQTTRDESESIKEVNAAVDDGGGCVESWERLSEMRSQSDDDRRTFVKRLGMTIGALPLVAGTAAGQVGTTTVNENRNQDITVDEIHGRKRGQLLREANRATRTALVTEQLGGRPGVSSVVEYQVGDGVGYGVTYSSGDENTIVRYYRSEEMDSGTKMLGGNAIDGGIRTVDGEEGAIFDIGTTKAVDAAKRVLENERIESPTARSRATPNEAEAVLFQTADSSPEAVLYIPLVDDDQIVDRLVARGNEVNGKPIEENVSVSAASDGVSTESHVRCIGPVCTDYCSLLCAALPAGSGAACGTACLRYIAKWPIAVACGAICWAVGEGVCYPTCTNQTGH